MTHSRKQLLEAAFPLREVSEASHDESHVRSGHLRTLHIWWARRPLAASRATALAALLPEDPSHHDEYLQLIKDVSPWAVAAEDTPQNKLLLERARDLILANHGGKAPRILDCFAGGGAIPLEALRLGCETYALDYNPVAVLVNKAAIEYPERFGKPRIVRDSDTGHLGMEGEGLANPLIDEVKRWTDWIFVEAQKELQQFYPTDKDGSVPIAFLWARTLPCQAAECGADIPVLRQTWLAQKNVKDKKGNKKAGKRVALRIIPLKAKRRVEFEVVEGDRIDFDPSQGTVSAAYVRCPVCTNTIDDDTTRRLFREGKSGQRMIGVVLKHPDRKGKSYRLPTQRDIESYRAAETTLDLKRKNLSAVWGIDPVPDEQLPLMSGTFNVPLYGMTKWGDLFNARQKLSLITLCEKVRLVRTRTHLQDEEFLKAISLYCAFVLDKISDFSSVLCAWGNDDEGVKNTFTSKALPMIWDYAETNVMGSLTGSWRWSAGLVLEAVRTLCNVSTSPATVVQGSATQLPWKDNEIDAVLTDPPYYINVPYADLSDFFYVWLKRSVGDMFPELLATPLTPKSDEVGQMAHWDTARYAFKDKKWFEDMLTLAFREIKRVLKPEGIAVIVFAYPKAEAWEAVINATLKAELYLTASWPIKTEMQARLRAIDSATLTSSIYMVCRKRTTKEIGEFPNIKREIDQRVREKLDEFWAAGIRGADFFMSAIGPAVEVFGRYESVEKLSGEKVEVKELLDYVERVVSEFALERILGSTELGGVDPETRFYLLWRWTYGNARVSFDEARKLATAVGAELTALWGEGRFVKKEKEFVRVLSPKEREKDKKFANQIGFNTMVDALHRACLYWERGERRELREHLLHTYGANNTFWRVAQNIADVLPDGEKEKQLLQGLLNVPEARDRVMAVTENLFS